MLRHSSGGQTWAGEIPSGPGRAVPSCVLFAPEDGRISHHVTGAPTEGLAPMVLWRGSGGMAPSSEMQMPPGPDAYAYGKPLSVA